MLQNKNKINNLNKEHKQNQQKQKFYSNKFSDISNFGSLYKFALYGLVILVGILISLVFIYIKNVYFASADGGQLNFVLESSKYDESSGRASVLVCQSQVSNNSTTFQITNTPGNPAAQSGSDYTIPSSSLEISPGQLCATFNFILIDDDQKEDK